MFSPHRRSMPGFVLPPRHFKQPSGIVLLHIIGFFDTSDPVRPETGADFEPSVPVCRDDCGYIDFVSWCTEIACEDLVQLAHSTRNDIGRQFPVIVVLSATQHVDDKQTYSSGTRSLVAWIAFLALSTLNPFFVCSSYAWITASRSPLRYSVNKFVMGS